MNKAEKLLDAYLDVADRDIERAAIAMAREILRLRSQPGYDRHGQ